MTELPPPSVMLTTLVHMHHDRASSTQCDGDPVFVPIQPLPTSSTQCDGGPCNRTIFNSVIYFISMQKHSLADALLNEVFTHLHILERDYFGLAYQDEDITVWIRLATHWVWCISKCAVCAVCVVCVVCGVCCVDVYGMVATDPLPNHSVCVRACMPGLLCGVFYIAPFLGNTIFLVNCQWLVHIATANCYSSEVTSWVDHLDSVLSCQLFGMEAPVKTCNQVIALFRCLISYRGQPNISVMYMFVCLFVCLLA